MSTTTTAVAPQSQRAPGEMSEEPTPPLEPKFVNRLTRYLHTGSEIPKYYPGCWLSHKYYELEKLPVLNEIYTASPNNVEVLDIILKAYKDGYWTRYETIAFALTKCLRLGTSQVKTYAYKVATEICTTPEELLIFNKFTRLLKTGNGRGWCKHIQDWYNNKDAMILAKEMTRVKSRHGRSHKTLIRKAHVKVPDSQKGHDAVMKYVIYGLKKAKQVMVDSDEAKDIFDYLQKVEDIRHCEDPEAAGVLAAQSHFSLEHVPGHLLTSQEVWDAILPQFTIDQLLHSLHRIHNMGFLSSNSSTAAVLMSMLTNKDVIKNSKVTPISAFIALCNYKKKSKPLKFEKAKVAKEKEQRRRSRQMFDAKTGLWEWTVTRRHPKEVKHWGIDQPPNVAVISALQTLMDNSWALTKPTNVRYLITMDMRVNMFRGRHFCKNYVPPKKGKKVVVKPAPGAGGDADTEKKSKKHLLAECFYNKNVTPGHAAIILAMQILKREEHVDLAVFTEEGVETVEIDHKITNMEEVEAKLKAAPLGRVQLDAPIEWAAKASKKVDVFINMVDRTTRYMELDAKARGGRGPGARFGPPPCPLKGLPDHCPVRALERYRTAVEMPNAKLVVLSLASHRVGTTDGSHTGVLDIVGLDEHVPRLLDAFAEGQFQ